MGKTDLGALLNRIKTKKGNNAPATSKSHGTQRLFGVFLVAGVLFFLIKKFKKESVNYDSENK